MTAQLERMRSGAGFIAALDQSGGSTPKALKLYGVDETAYANEAEMFEQVHAMRVRIMTSDAFTSEHILGAILFENTMHRTVDGVPTSQYLWGRKQIVPFLKVDKGLADEDGGVQLMKPMPGLSDLLTAANQVEVFGTKMRSVIKSANADGIKAVVDQQFQVAGEILNAGLVPIIEPEVDIHAPDKAACEALLRDQLNAHLDALDADLPVMFKLTLPDAANFYQVLCTHPKVLRVVALSGGYSREEANRKLAENTGVIASFSRALTEGLNINLSDGEYRNTLAASVNSISAASAT